MKQLLIGLGMMLVLAAPRAAEASCMLVVNDGGYDAVSGYAWTVSYLGYNSNGFVYTPGGALSCYSFQIMGYYIDWWIQSVNPSGGDWIQDDGDFVVVTEGYVPWQGYGDYGVQSVWGTFQFFVYGATAEGDCCFWYMPEGEFPDFLDSPEQFPPLVVTASPPLTLWAVGAYGEDGKGNHYVTAKDAAPIEISLALLGGLDPSVVSWGSDGTLQAGGSNLEKIVGTSTPGTVNVWAYVGPHPAVYVVLHIADATAPPSASPQLTKETVSPPVVLPDTEWGRTWVSITGSEAVAQPDFEFDPFIQGNKWVFRLISAKQFVAKVWQSRGRVDLPYGSVPSPFPLPPPTSAGYIPGMSESQARAEAKEDFNTINICCIGNPPVQFTLYPLGPYLAPPRMRSYWSEFVVKEHEDAHDNEFHTFYWTPKMHLFADFVRASDKDEVFDCSPSSLTATSGSVKTIKQGVFRLEINRLHREADQDNYPVWEMYPSVVSNTKFQTMSNSYVP